MRKQVQKQNNKYYAQANNNDYTTLIPIAQHHKLATYVSGKDSVECSEFHEEVALLRKYLLVLQSLVLQILAK